MYLHTPSPTRPPPTLPPIFPSLTSRSLYRSHPHSLAGSSSGASATKLSMVFDFLKKRSEEGIAQVQNIATKTLEGRFGEALSDSAEYIKKRNRIDAENLRKLSSGKSSSCRSLYYYVFLMWWRCGYAVIFLNNYCHDCNEYYCLLLVALG